MKGTVKLVITLTIPIDTNDYDTDTVEGVAREILKPLNDGIYGVEEVIEFADDIDYECTPLNNEEN